jgi:hypothetical protein
VVGVNSFSAEEWERFTEEWLSSRGYARVAHPGAAGDKGLGVICFLSEAEFAWRVGQLPVQTTNHPLLPSDLWIEISKHQLLQF